MQYQLNLMQLLFLAHLDLAQRSLHNFDDVDFRIQGNYRPGHRE